ncbi:unnamed protein product [Auanema sp. JU1783]|nr:unnamed protein product [Auanema sp. JU1783]
MAEDLKKKQYGLVVKAKKEDKPLIRKAAAVFDEEDECDDKVDVSYSKTSASTIRMHRQAQMHHERALAEDPTVFDYDASYDEIQAIKNEKISEQKKKDENRESKYASELIKSKLRRDLEKQSREERQQQLEREKEGDEFADKEVFITNTYKEQMKLVVKHREEEQYEAMFNKMTSVEHQKAWQAGFGRTLLNDLARTGLTKKSDEPEEQTSFSDAKKKGVKNIRKRNEDRSPSPKLEPAEESTKKKSIYDDDEDDDKPVKQEPKKSIYDDDDNGPEFKPPPLNPHRNFEGELKPGLNRVVKKALTHVEKLERQFTPTPPSSDDEDSSKKEKERRKEREEEKRKEEEKKKADEEEKKQRLKLIRMKPEELRAKRLVRLKEIVSQRNGPEEIEAYRERYLQRRDINFVEPPLC